MKFINIIQITLATALMTLSFNLFADGSTLSCPTSDLVAAAWHAMDDAIPDDHSYIVTSKPIIPFSDRLWSVRTVVPARNQQDAIKLAQITVRETKALMSRTPIKIFNQYGCVYFSARAYVYALTDSN